MAKIQGKHLTTDEVAAILGVSPARIRQFVSDNRLKPSQKIGQAYLFDIVNVQEMAKKPRLSGRPKNCKNTACKA